MFLRLCLKWLVALLLVLVCKVVTQEAKSDPDFLIRGRCPEVILGDGFDKEKFANTWYRIGGTPNFEEHSVNCTVYNYASTESGYDVSSNGLGRNGSEVTQSTSLTQVKNGTARFTTFIRNIEAEMVVLNTDYTSYACLFTCYNFRKSHKVHFAWILSRNSTLQREKVTTCTKELKKVSIPLNSLKGTYQDAECALGRQ